MHGETEIGKTDLFSFLLEPLFFLFGKDLRTTGSVCIVVCVTVLLSLRCRFYGRLMNGMTVVDQLSCVTKRTMRPPKSSFSSTSGGPPSCIERALNEDNPTLPLEFGALSSESSICARLLFATDSPALSLIPFGHSVAILDIDRDWLTSNYHH